MPRKKAFSAKQKKEQLKKKRHYTDKQPGVIKLLRAKRNIYCSFKKIVWGMSNDCLSLLLFTIYYAGAQKKAEKYSHSPIVSDFNEDSGENSVPTSSVNSKRNHDPDRYYIKDYSTKITIT